MAIKDRVRRLERSDSRGCGVCNYPNISVNFIWRDAETSAEETPEPEREPEPREPKYCPGCGRETTLRLHWSDSLLMPEKTTNEGDRDD